MRIIFMRDVAIWRFLGLQQYADNRLGTRRLTSYAVWLLQQSDIANTLLCAMVSREVRVNPKLLAKNGPKVSG